MTCVFIDDEPLAVKILESFAKEFPVLEILGSFNNPIEAFTIIENHKVDVIFIDINMPKMSGLDFIKSLSYKPVVVITTAYREYAVEGYDLDVLDYLVKPIPLERFAKSVQKITSEVRNKQRNLSPSSEMAEYSFYKVDKKLVKIKHDDILYIESLKDYIKIYTPDKYYVIHKSLSGITEELPKNKFIRIHRSFTISVDKIQSLEGNMVEIQNKRLPIGRKYMMDSKKIIFREAYE